MVKLSEKKREKESERRNSNSYKDPYLSNISNLFQTEIPTGHKLPGEPAVYIYCIYIYHAYAFDHVGYAHSQLHCNLVWGETQDNQLMNHLKSQ